MNVRPTDQPLDVGIVGAGAAGLATIRALTAAGHRVRAFEASDRVGGLWNDGYQSLHLITAKNLCDMDGYPIPDEFPLFPHRDQIVAYFNGFADRFGLRDHISFRTRVVRVSPLDRNGMGGWEIACDDGSTHRFDAVILANGHLSTPIMPELPGSFGGRIIHSHDYRTPSDFVGDRILVIGGGNSGCDIAVDAVQQHLRTSIVIRTGQVFQPKTLLGRGRTQLPVGFLPPVLRERVMRTAIRIAYGRTRDYPGLPAPATENIDKNPGVINTQVLHWIHHGRLTVRPGIRAVDGDLVTFDDGTSDRFDTIVAATGYAMEIPFLADDLIPWVDGHPLRYAEGTTFPRLANIHVIGLVGPQGAQWPVYDRQSQAVLRLMRIQSRIDHPVADELARIEEPWTEVNMLRWVWDARVDRFERRLTRLERSLAPSRSRPRSRPTDAHVDHESLSHPSLPIE